ncbi:hypothetical protein FQZ97_880680 [compost metagenome]
MFSAATMRPCRFTMGAATEIRPSSSSWFTRHHCCLRAWATLAMSASMSVTVCLVSASRFEASSRARTSSSLKSASSRRPNEVQYAGSREPTPRLMRMIFCVGTRST